MNTWHCAAALGLAALGFGVSHGDTIVTPKPVTGFNSYRKTEIKSSGVIVKPGPYVKQQTYLVRYVCPQQQSKVFAAPSDKTARSYIRMLTDMGFQAALTWGQNNGDGRYLKSYTVRYWCPTMQGRTFSTEAAARAFRSRLPQGTQSAIMPQ